MALDVSMSHGDWVLFAAFFASLTTLNCGLACLLWAEKNQRDSLGWLETAQKGRRLQVLGWLGICFGIPLTILFFQRWIDSRFI
jgi:hypothetical protein